MKREYLERCALIFGLLCASDELDGSRWCRNERAKAICPKDRLLVIRLEDGMSREKVCPLLGLPHPSHTTPKGNLPQDLEALMEGLTAPRHT